MVEQTSTQEQFVTSQIRLFYSGLPLKSREVFYVESIYNEKVNDFITTHYDSLLRLFARNGFILRYLPLYTHNKLDSSRFLTFTDGDETEKLAPSLVYWSDEYDSINKSSDDLTLKSIAIGKEKGLVSRFKDLVAHMEVPLVDDGYDLFSKGIMFHGLPSDIDAITRRRFSNIVNEIQQIKDRFPSLDVLFDTIKVELKPTDAIVIDKQHRIILKGYNSNEVLASKPLAKAFFLLFLRHEEGIYKKDLDDFIPEYQAIYRAIVGRPLNDTEKRRIQQLYKSSTDRLHEIKEAFSKIVNKESLGSYLIDGRYGMEKKILFPRDCVTWECEDIPMIVKCKPSHIEKKKLD